jgi:hypothetical protein
MVERRGEEMVWRGDEIGEEVRWSRWSGGEMEWRGREMERRGGVTV